MAITSLQTLYLIPENLHQWRGHARLVPNRGAKAGCPCIRQDAMQILLLDAATSLWSRR